MCEDMRIVKEETAKRATHIDDGCPTRRLGDQTGDKLPLSLINIALTRGNQQIHMLDINVLAVNLKLLLHAYSLSLLARKTTGLLQQPGLTLPLPIASNVGACFP